ncbi:hypothetical protein K4F52_004214 [Lecanicillium sp. MT-2017a]|nr:hypothetical protein K4F52_004214 [Lecanicillium sp. MT-2017a]
MNVPIPSIETDEISPAQDELNRQTAARLRIALGLAASQRLPIRSAPGSVTTAGRRRRGGSVNEAELELETEIEDTNRNPDNDGFIVKTYEVDATFRYEEKDLELPGELDAQYFPEGYGVPRYPRTDPKERLAAAPKIAPYPRIPDPYDDKPLMEVVTKRVPIKPAKKKRKRTNEAKRRPKKRRSNDDNVAPTEEIIEMPPPPPLPPVYKVKGFIGLPDLVRDQIYRYLLLAENPIRVHGSWELVFRNQRLNLSSSILRVSKQIHHEAARILYGENTFHYLLRDGPSTVRNVAQIAYDDTVDPAADAEESESDWQDGNTTSARRPALRLSGRRARQRPAENKDINLDTYKSYFRSISIEAEHNRFREDTRERLANAISVFAVDSDSQQQQPVWLRNLTIRVSPMWEPKLRKSGKRGDLTFVDFFASDTNVMAAIRKVPSDFLVVKLLVWHQCSSVRTGRATRAQARAEACPSCSSAKKGCAVMLDMRPYHTFKGTYAPTDTDVWGHDDAMKWERKRRHNVLEKRLEGLQTLITKCCRDEKYGERGVPKRREEGEGEEEGEEDEDVIELIEIDDETDEDYIGE